MKNKEIIINNENAHLLAEKSALEKNLKKHSMFINALSWKKFNANKKKPGDGSSKSDSDSALGGRLLEIRPAAEFADAVGEGAPRRRMSQRN